MGMAITPKPPFTVTVFVLRLLAICGYGSWEGLKTDLRVHRNTDDGVSGAGEVRFQPVPYKRDFIQLMETNMHKGFDLLDDMHGQEEIPDEVLMSGKKNIIFLDIDGVIQPYRHEYRFGHSIDHSLAMLSEMCDPILVKEGDPWDIVAAYYDWDEIAMGRLAKLCRHCGAYIVLHSSWIEFNSLERLRLFFSFYGLADYVLDVCPEVTQNEKDESREKAGYYIDEKAIKIRKWLKLHANEVRDYIVIDDHDMSWSFGEHFLITSDRLKESDYLACADILSGYRSIEQVDENTISSGGAYARYQIAPIGSMRGLFFATAFSQHNDSDHDWHHRMADYRLLVMHLLEQYFWEGRDEQYDDVSYFCWCLKKEQESLARWEQKDTMESMSGYHWIDYGNYDIQMPILEAEGVKRLNRQSEETIAAYKMGLQLLGRLGKE